MQIAEPGTGCISAFSPPLFLDIFNLVCYPMLIGGLTMKDKAVYTTKEAADYLGVSPPTIYRMEKRGLLSPRKTSRGQRRFSQKTLEECLRKRQSFKTPLIRETSALYEITTKAEPYPAPLYYKVQNSIWIYNADILRTDCVKEKTIDLIVTSPPYNVDIKYNSHDDKMSYEDYLSFTREWLTKCYRLMKDDGRFCLNIPLDKNKGGQQSVCADITTIAKQVGWKYHSTIVWNEQNISRRTAWGSWLSASAPYVIAPVEVIVILYKKQWKKVSGSRKSDISKKEFMDWTNGVWNFMGESKKRIGHPTPFPVELPKRCIRLFSFVDDTVLDPFLGSGSTLIACVLTNRKGIGIEIDNNYCKLAKQRLIREAEIYQLKLGAVEKVR
ncbi:MAG: site-specific DNA-methyltransferase [Armatimonadetes bacterium CG07_land_8_20_14_0_80_40_9]|nr:MAG: site-specific DNA-methyltransferase [Armatimonadetes bacterium CG07_land_8_20_14_0_80_40_9]